MLDNFNVSQNQIDCLRNHFSRKSFNYEFGKQNIRPSLTSSIIFLNFLLERQLEFVIEINYKKSSLELASQQINACQSFGSANTQARSVFRVKDAQHYFSRHSPHLFMVVVCENKFLANTGSKSLSFLAYIKNEEYQRRHTSVDLFRASFATN